MFDGAIFRRAFAIVDLAVGSRRIAAAVSTCATPMS
jgi:hypothetical protein